MKNIRIKLSIPRMVIFCMVILACVLPALFMNSVFGYLPLLFILFFGIFSSIYASLIVSRVRCTELSEISACVRGEKAHVKFEIQNLSPFICPNCKVLIYVTDIYGKVRSCEEFCLTLSSAEKRTAAFEVKFDHVGSYEVGIEKLCAGGLLGIVTFSNSVNVSRSIDVLPKVHNLDGLALSKNIQAESIYANRAFAEENVDFAGVREYSFGDPIKRIHWKLSAHTGNYVTKQLENYGNYGMTIIACARMPGSDIDSLMDTYDSVIECCAALYVYAGRNGMDIEILAEDTNGNVVRRYLAGDDDIAPLIEIIPQAYKKKTDEKSQTELLKAEVSNRYANSNIAVCTAMLDEDFADIILRLALGGKSVLVFYIQPYSLDEPNSKGERAFNRLRSYGVPCYLIQSADEIGKAVSR